MKTISILKGGSGAGKGTRLCYLIKFLERQYKWDWVDFDLPNGKKFRAGISFPDLDLFIAGDFVKSQKSNLTSWTGLDNYFSKLGGTEGTLSMLKTLSRMAGHLIMEGGPLTLSDKFRARYMRKAYDAENVFSFYFSYNDNEELFLERLRMRSGDKAGCSDETIKKALVRYEVEYEKSLVETSEGEGVCRMNPATDCPSVFLEQFLNEVLGLKIESGELADFCANNSFMREIGRADPLSKTPPLW